MNTKQVGTISEAMALARFMSLGWKVLMPFGDNERYDLVIDRGNGFETVQVKTGRVRKGCVIFNASSTVGHTGSHYSPDKSYQNEVDLFCVYCPELDSLYLLPVDAVGAYKGHLRIDPPKSAQPTVVMADQYLL